MKIKVDYDRCTGMGMCESLAPDVFDDDDEDDDPDDPDVFEVEDDGSLTLHTDRVPEGQEDEVREAVAACPTEALSLEE